MAMQHCRYNSPFIQYVLSLTLFKEDEFMLVDVGASGGIDQFWRQLEPVLKAVGFEPLVSEVHRLNSIEKNDKIKYIDGWVTCKDKAVLAGVNGEGYATNMSFAQTSAVKASEVMNLNYIETYFNSGEAVIHSDQRFTLDDYCSNANLNNVDFLKIDTDGHDYFVLRGAEQMLASADVLGIQVECQLHGSLHPQANLFSNIDLFLRGMGYTLFDLDCWRYTKRALPGEFYYQIPAQTKQGQVQWCEALYIKDPVFHEGMLDSYLSTTNYHKILSLLVIFELYGQGDSAAALIIELRARDFDMPGVNYDELLNLLVPKNRWGIRDYATYIKQFETDPTGFYPEQSSR